jgi:IS30 family transposase
LQYLPRGRRKRGKRQGRKVRSERIKWRTSIHHHPAEIEDRGQFGHWEADNVLGAHGTGGLHVSVERSSLYLVGVKIPAITAQATLEAQQAVFTVMPAHAAPSVTADNGSEFAYQYRLADTLDIPTYFADRYSAYQRGTNEHFNARIRRYLPKGTRFTELTLTELHEYITETNNWPRKILA